MGSATLQLEVPDLHRVDNGSNGNPVITTPLPKPGTTLVAVAREHGFEVEQPLTQAGRAPAGSTAPAWRAAYVFAWLASAYWSSVAQTTKDRVLADLADGGTASELAGSAIGMLDGSPAGLRRMLLETASVVDAVEAGTIPSSAWGELPDELGILEDEDLDNKAFEAIGWLQAALWARDTARLGGQRYIASWDGPVMIEYTGPSTDLDAFLFRSHMLGVPELIVDEEIAEELPGSLESWLNNSDIGVLRDVLLRCLCSYEPAVADPVPHEFAEASIEVEWWLSDHLALIRLGDRALILHRVETRDDSDCLAPPDGVTNDYVEALTFALNILVLPVEWRRVAPAFAVSTKG